MEIYEGKLKQLQQQPIVETHIGKSRDGKWIITKTVITDIRPVNYLKKILGD